MLPRSHILAVRFGAGLVLAALARKVSAALFLLNPRKFSRHFKCIICNVIPRFESWRPSQQVVDLAHFLRSAPNAREQRAFATSDIVCASQTRRKGVKFGVCLSGVNLASVFVRENASRSYSLAPTRKRKIREPRDLGRWPAPSPTAAVQA
jgi:hypothetical protein